MRSFHGSFESGAFQGWPLPDPFHGLALLWRGYLSNLDEIHREAARRGLFPEGRSTGEGLALAYRCWGASLQARALGEYAVAIFDPGSSRLLLTHDALGLLPLFYRNEAQGLRFASHLQDLVSQAGAADLDEDYLAGYVIDGYGADERTPYRAVKRLDIGASLLAEDRKTTVQRTWRPANPSRIDGTEDEIDARFRTLLTEAVRGAAPSRGAVWTELSGGLDSSTVTCLTARLGIPDHRAVSFLYPCHPQADETEWIRAVLDRYPVPWEWLDADETPPYHGLPGRFMAEPGLHLANCGWHQRYNARLREREVAAVLTGQGGDWVLFGCGMEPYCLADRLSALQWSRLRAELAHWRSGDAANRSASYWLGRYALHPLWSRWRRQPLRGVRDPAPAPWFRSDYLKTLSRILRRPCPVWEDCRGVEHYWFTRGLYALARRVSSLNQTAESADFRHPLLHRPLIDFMASLPPGQKFDPRMDRFVQRRALHEILPGEVRLRREKTLLDQPRYEGLRTSTAWYPLLTEAPRIADLGMVDLTRWREAVAQARMGRTHYLPQFEAVATLEIWLRQLDRSGTRAVESQGTIDRGGLER